MIELYNSDTEKAWRCPDGEVKTMIDIRDRVPLSVRHIFTYRISDKQQQVIAGVAMVPKWVQEELFRLDPYLRIRWDFYPPNDKIPNPCFLIERVDTSLRAWLPLFWHCDDNGVPGRLGVRDVFEIIEKLKEGDMRRFADPQDYLDHKRDKARQVRMANSKKSEAKILAAVDSLSNKQVAQFIAVERALKFGEKVDVYGKDADFLNRQWERQKRFGHAPIPSSRQAINPGMQPGKYERGPKGG